jgi:hypothetical protein
MVGTRVVVCRHDPRNVLVNAVIVSVLSFVVVVAAAAAAAAATATAVFVDILQTAIC